MKNTLILLFCLGIGLAGAIAYVKAKTSSTTATATLMPAETVVAATPDPIEPAPMAAKPAKLPAELTPPLPPTPVASATLTNPESEAAAALRQTVDHLLAPQYSGQKLELMDRLRTSGQIDAAIADLQRRAKENSGDANIHTTLGEAMLNKVRLLHETGADINEQGILAMQADQSFNAALKVDPTSWEAQFVKYSTMYYWPAELQRDTEVAQKLSSLIDQQDAQPSLPHFAQTYVVLGNEYVKMGKPDFAEATWRLGLAKFPNDSTLLAKIAGGK
jgi:tetratricopeptide (TPR) repeat protein